jgi:RNA polymerase sigma-70 factor (ECF subfamily)
MAREESGTISELVREAQRGSPAAFDALVRRFRELMLAVARQEIGSREAAEDVVQDALLQAFRALPQLQDPARFVPWLTVITRCRARRVGRRSRRHEPLDLAALEGLLDERAERPPHPAEECLRAAERSDVRAALDRLPRDQGAILRLYYFEGWPVRRIADHLSLPVSTVKWRLHSGRRMLQRQLTMHGSAGAVAGAIRSIVAGRRGLRRRARGVARWRSRCVF